jgi:hypothetical protein
VHLGDRAQRERFTSVVTVCSQARQRGCKVSKRGISVSMSAVDHPRVRDGQCVPVPIAYLLIQLGSLAKVLVRSFVVVKVSVDQAEPMSGHGLAKPIADASRDVKDLLENTCPLAVVPAHFYQTSCGRRKTPGEI